MSERHITIKLLRAVRLEAGLFVSGAQVRMPSAQAVELVRAGRAVLVDFADADVLRSPRPEGQAARAA
jgi:hypothetical protein